MPTFKAMVMNGVITAEWLPQARFTSLKATGVGGVEPPTRGPTTNHYTDHTDSVAPPPASGLIENVLFPFLPRPAVAVRQSFAHGKRRRREATSKEPIGIGSNL